MFGTKVKATGNYTSLYFYSNNVDNYNACQEYIRSLAQNNNISSNNIHMMVRSFESFEHDICDLIEDSGFNYSNALVIFDMSSEIMEDHNPNTPPGSYFTRLLKGIFSSLKQNNCKIMFISGIPEIRFSTPGEANNSQGNYNEFLDYVDIHIDVSTFDLFYMSMIVKIEEETDGSYATLIFDENTQLYDKVMDYYQRKYDYDNVIIDESTYTLKKYLFNTYSLQIITYDEVHGTFIDYDDEISSPYIDEIIINPDVYAIGMINSADNFEEWITKINFTEELLEETWTLFLYNNIWLNISDYDILGSVYHLYKYSYLILEDAMSDVISAFINGEELTVYDNWYGRCQITYRPSSGDGEGWMSNFQYHQDGDGPVYDFGYICIYGLPQ